MVFLFCLLSWGKGHSKSMRIYIVSFMKMVVDKLSEGAVMLEYLESFRAHWPRFKTKSRKR